MSWSIPELTLRNDREVHIMFKRETMMWCVSVIDCTSDNRNIISFKSYPSRNDAYFEATNISDSNNFKLVVHNE